MRVKHRLIGADVVHTEPKVLCPFCLRLVSRHRSGKLRIHGMYKPYVTCLGSKYRVK